MFQVRTLTPNFTIVTLKMWAYSPQIAESGNFGYKFAQKGYVYPLKRFLQNLAWGGFSRFVPLRQISPLSLLKCGFTAPKIAEIGNFGYKFAQKGYTPLSIFYNIWLGGGSPGSAPSYQISPFWLLKCGPTAAKIAKNRNFWYKFAPIEKFFGVHRKS